jgi:cytochrome c553
MSTLLSRIPPSVQGVALHAVFALPPPARRLLAGPPIRRDGLELALDAQLLLRMIALTELTLSGLSPDTARTQLELGRTMLGEPAVPGVRTRNVNVAATDGTMPARLYEPANLAAGSPLLVFFTAAAGSSAASTPTTASAATSPTTPTCASCPSATGSRPSTRSPPAWTMPIPPSPGRDARRRRSASIRRTSRSAAKARARTSPPR